jgi:D-aminopeptidase
MKQLIYMIIISALFSQVVVSDDHIKRARDIGIPFQGAVGPLNAITDVAGVTVGHETIIKDLEGGNAVRTGVTAILPRGKSSNNTPVFAASFALNGNGEMTGTTWIEESGMLEGPVLITNTHSVGIVRDAAIAWRIAAGDADSSGYWWSLPVVTETWDGYLNDINGFHVKAEHAQKALDQAKGGPVEEGNVGGGTGMICHEFKCGIGTSSRIASTMDGPFTVGVLVQANYGMRDTLRIAGVPVGQYLREQRVYSENDSAASETGSIIIVVATDAPLLPHQIKRLAKRASLGLARNGGIAGNGSGDIFIAFSTANKDAGQSGAAVPLTMMTNDNMDPLFLATVQATEEAIINAMVAGKDMTGKDGRKVKAISHEALRTVLSKYNRLIK